MAERTELPLLAVCGSKLNFWHGASTKKRLRSFKNISMAGLWVWFTYFPDSHTTYFKLSSEDGGILFHARNPGANGTFIHMCVYVGMMVLKAPTPLSSHSFTFWQPNSDWDGSFVWIGNEFRFLVRSFRIDMILLTWHLGRTRSG